jgi:hypothetical protein
VEILIHGMVLFGHLHLGFTSMVSFPHKKQHFKWHKCLFFKSSIKLNSSFILSKWVPFVPIFFYQFNVLHHIFFVQMCRRYLCLHSYLYKSFHQSIYVLFYYALNHAMIINKRIFINVKFTIKSHNISLKKFNLCTFDLVAYLYVLPHFVVCH